jgi:hypothetical protein
MSIETVTISENLEDYSADPYALEDSPSWEGKSIVIIGLELLDDLSRVEGANESDLSCNSYAMDSIDLPYNRMMNRRGLFDNTEKHQHNHRKGRRWPPSRNCDSEYGSYAGQDTFEFLKAKRRVAIEKGPVSPTVDKVSDGIPQLLLGFLNRKFGKSLSNSSNDEESPFAPVEKQEVPINLCEVNPAA